LNCWTAEIIILSHRTPNVGTCFPVQARKKKVSLRRPRLCKSFWQMQSSMRLVSSALFCIGVLAVFGCHSAPTRGDVGQPAPVYTPRPASHEEEITLIRADSEVFAAVVRAQLRAGTDEYPYQIEELRYDPRPYGSRDGYPELSAGVQGAAPELYFARAGQDAIDQIISNRKIILEQRNVPEGSPF